MSIIWLCIYMTCMICTWLHPIFKAQRATLIAIKTRKSRMAQGQSTSEFANFNAYAAIEEADQFWRSWKIKLRGPRVDLKRWYFDVCFSTLIEIEEVYEIKEMTICGSPQTHPDTASGWKKNPASQESIRSIACKDAILFLLFLQDMYPTGS